MMKLNTMRTRLDGLVIFRGILQANIVPAFRAMLAAAGSEDFVSAAADFENQLFERGGSWTRVLLDAVLQDENICIRKAASGGAGRPLPAAWTASWNFCSSSAALRWLI